ncbi:hypothetical protein P691DRAFT_596581 [Macrolepiota fuliginosa MF-IS2]|uniref:Uncharacterized protein n=1 Tax=Macrolepiota fuliginosa MF-IS2 TaxID=1400762 RepID=A0A9P6BX81_9AGAR|nr:hypothetical protein P691DRAFT_596581 [Macrolepiota fuliginosa MF-IS2]
MDSMHTAPNYTGHHGVILVTFGSVVSDMGIVVPKSTFCSSKDTVDILIIVVGHTAIATATMGSVPLGRLMRIRDCSASL